MPARTTDDPRYVLLNRFETLDVLLTGPHSKPELVDELDCSRSTVDRAVDDLLELDCIERTAPNGSQYRATTLGELLYRSHQDYHDRITQLQAVRPILTELPSDAPVSEAIVLDADVYRSVQTPDIAFRPAQELLPDATKMVGTAPVVYREYFEVFLDRLDEGPFEFEVVLESSLFETIDRHYREEFDALTAYDSVRVYETETSIPYGLWVMDRPGTQTAGITFYNEGGVPGAIVNDTDDAVEWATDQYTEYRQHATRIV
ncbi:helix-turn-helix transcriptional regulator [Halobacterium yunchengense]|uniref:helix-turn-helix transcriptional regulator n=1 Tax=Halobacterium yunchengense TaxID=3108497 RepID=UPI003008C158